MRATRLLVLSLFSCLLAAFAVSACRSSNAYDIAQQQAGGVTLVVRNDNFADMDVYALSSGLATRIGTVTGNSTGQFALSPSMFGPDEFRVIATPIGGNGRASSGRLLVSPGQTVDFRIAPVLSQSSASVR